MKELPPLYGFDSICPPPPETLSYGGIHFLELHPVLIMLLEYDQSLNLHYLDSYFNQYPDDVNLELEVELARDYVVKMTPLMIACALALPDAVTLLLRYGANINTVNRENHTAMTFAIRYAENNESSKCVETLLSHNPNLYICDDEGWTFLTIAVSCATTSIGLDCVDHIIRALDDPSYLDIQNNEGWTALMIGCRFSCDKIAMACCELIIRNGGNVNIKNQQGATALMITSEFTRSESSIDCVKLLLTAGCDRTLCNDNMMTALDIAVICEHSTSTSETVDILAQDILAI